MMKIKQAENKGLLAFIGFIKNVTTRNYVEAGNLFTEYMKIPINPATQPLDSFIRNMYTKTLKKDYVTIETMYFSLVLPKDYEKSVYFIRIY